MATKTERGYAQALKKYEEAKAKLQAIQSKERSFTSLFTANKEGADALKQLKEAERDLSKWTKSGQTAQGMLGVAVDTVLGLPDLASQAINYGIRKVPEIASQANLGTGKVSNQTLSNLVATQPEERFQLPVLGDIVKDSLGLREQAPTEELQIYQATPGYLAMALGAGQLAKLGWQGFTKFRNSRATKDLIKSLAPDEANAFKKWMVNGQGTDSTEMQAVINKVKSDAKSRLAKTKNKEMRAAIELTRDQRVNSLEIKLAEMRQKAAIERSHLQKLTGAQKHIANLTLGSRQQSVEQVTRRAKS